MKKSRYFVTSTGPDIGFENKTSSRDIAVIKEISLPRTEGKIIEEGAPRADLDIVLLRCRLKPLSSMNTNFLSSFASSSKKF